MAFENFISSIFQKLSNILFIRFLKTVLYFNLGVLEIVSCWSNVNKVFKQKMVDIVNQISKKHIDKRIKVLKTLAL